MSKLTFVIAALLAFTASAAAQTLDTYGGVIQTPCPGGATGEWYMQQIGHHSVFCDPLGNAFIDRGVWYVAGDNHTDPTYVPQSFQTVTGAKYAGNTNAWFNAELSRLSAWRFNAEGPGSYLHATDSGITVKLPFAEYLSQANNEWIGCEARAQCKNILNLRWPLLFPYSSNENYNVPDAWEPTWPTTAATAFNSDSNISSFASSPYTIGFFIGDTDFCSFCSAGVDFPTDPQGSYWPHANYYILGSAPHDWLNRWNSNALFTDQTNYSKAHWSSVLSAEYGTIGALNTAWGTGGYYTTFGTSGTQVTGGACATGNGGSVYSCTPHANIDRYSLRIDVGGTPVCADDGAGVLHGPADASCGAVTYSTGAISISKTVSNGVAITVDYWHDGFGVGTGILDEWADNSVHAWIGDYYCLNNGITSNVCNPGTVTTAAYRADMDNFLQQYTTQFFTVLHTAFVNALPAGHKGKLFFGMSSLGQVPGRSPARCPVLAGEAAVADAVQVGTDASTAQLDFITNCIGNKPFTLWESVTANADSDWYGYSPGVLGTWNKTTQALRAAQYNTDIQNLWNHVSAAGNSQWVGENWWAFLSFSFYEEVNFGLVSWRDNAYDGHDVVTGSVACSAPASAYTCGGEQNNYGNFLGPATVTNSWVDQQLAGLGGGQAGTGIQINGGVKLSGSTKVQ